MLITGCSTNDSTLVEEDQGSSSEIAQYNTEEAIDMEQPSDDDSEESTEESSLDISDRMIIHRANLTVNVKDIEESKQKVEKKVKEYEGYIVDSAMYVDDEEHVSGHLTVRIPEKHFQQFLTDAEEEAAEVVERNVSGQDVTEEYVDIESRLKSKQAVEARLLEFMEDAEKTEDLLKISNDLAKVQEEIEVLVGQQKYLDNQTSFSTIEIFMNETRVVIPELDNKSFDTWEQTKKQFAVSTNSILRAISGLTVFIFGNLPVIAIFLLIGGIIYSTVRRKKRNNIKND